LLSTNPVLTAGTRYERRRSKLTAYAEDSSRRGFRDDPVELIVAVAGRTGQDEVKDQRRPAATAG